MCSKKISNRAGNVVLAQTGKDIRRLLLSGVALSVLGLGSVLGASAPSIAQETGMVGAPEGVGLGEPPMDELMMMEEDSGVILPQPEDAGRNAPVAQPGTSALDLSAPAPASDTYYDSALNVPRGGLEDVVGIRKIDPNQEPASSYMIVHKEYDADSWESKVMAANKALKLKRYGAAADMFSRLYEKNPRDERVLMGHAFALQNMGRLESALNVYDELLMLDPDNKEAQLNMLGVLRQRYPHIAIKRLNNMRDKYPDDSAVLAQLALAQADMGDYEQAMQTIEVAASVDPTAAIHYFNMGVLAERMKQPRKAMQAYEKALELDSLYNAGQVIDRETVYDRLHVLRRH